MKYNLKRKNDAIEFLNTKALDFYQGKIEFIDNKDKYKIRASFLKALITIERTIRGTFNCDLSLCSVDISLFKKMFSNVCDNLFTINSKEDLKFLSDILISFRNLNAHFYIDKEDKAVLEQDFRFLENKGIKLNSNIHYTKNNKITIAGIVFLLANFLRFSTIKELNKIESFISLIICGDFTETLEETYITDEFITKISKINLETPIRQKGGKNIIDSIFGEYMDSVILKESSFSLIIGKEKYPTFKVTGSYNGTRFIVEKGSLTRTFYKNKYCLLIKDKEHFIELSNKLPVMGLIDFLYLSKIEEFNNIVYSKITEDQNFKSLLKINEPKLYSDKKIELLILKSEASDFRHTSSVLTTNIIQLFLNLEEHIYRKEGIKTYNHYSTIHDALDQIGVPSNIISEIKYLRNFCAHGYMIDDYMSYGLETKKFSLMFIVETLKILSKNLEIHNYDIYYVFSKLVCSLIINSLIGIKYSQINNETLNVLSRYPNYNQDELKKRSLYVKNSFFNINIFNNIVSPNLDTHRIIKLVVEGIEEELYLYETDDSYNLINSFCNSFLFICNQTVLDGLIVEKHLSKKQTKN